MRRRPARVPAPRSGFAGFRFPPEVIMVAVRWYLRFGFATVPARHGLRWFVDQTYLKVARRWVYLYRAIDQFGQVIDVRYRRSMIWRPVADSSPRAGARPAPGRGADRAPAYPLVLDELLPARLPRNRPIFDNLIEADHGRLKSRLRSMRGLKRLQ